MCSPIYRLYQILCIFVSRVTSQFILDGCLDALGMLSKLNLSRTTVCDSGMTRLQLPSLTMLNVNWTCVTERTSLDTLRRGECVWCVEWSVCVCGEGYNVYSGIGIPFSGQT